MRHQILSPVNDTSGDDKLCEAIRQIGVPRVAEIGRINERRIYRFLDGSVRSAKTRKKIEYALRKTQRRPE
jgi:hypothetical protein